MTLTESLGRTLLLMRDEVGCDVEDAVLIDALTRTEVVVVADETNIASHAAQAALITVAILAARSGHRVHVLAPNVRLLGSQPPLKPGLLVDELLKVGQDLLPGIEILANRPSAKVDLAIAIGDSRVDVDAGRSVYLNATNWAGTISGDFDAEQWAASAWPVGALVAAGLAAAEAFKIAMRKLSDNALNPSRFAAYFRDTRRLTYELAPPDTVCDGVLGDLDFISGGAITNAALYALARVPGVATRGRIVEPEEADLSNLNRYMLLSRSRCDNAKANDLATILAPQGFHFTPVKLRYEPGTAQSLMPLASTVVVGTDDIPSRWLVQHSSPALLVIGATTHWSAMASFHRAGIGCAQCLHRQDDPGNAPIPTVAFVSFWAGLMVAVYVLRHASSPAPAEGEQQMFVTPFRPERPTVSAVPIWRGCPTCGGRGATPRLIAA